MKEFVKSLKKDKLSHYKSDYHEMVAAFNREKATTSGYNGRQILELLQNCDDQESETVVIQIDKERKRLIIANEGIPFSEKGYRSLAISNLSAKTDKDKYIGNKGLGFRSILNWSESVSIYSNKIKVTFSEKIRNKTFKDSFEDDKIRELRNDYDLSDQSYPMPVLAVPEIIELDPISEFATVIELFYKEDYLTNIIRQINIINSETILFLKHIKKINFIGFENKDNIEIERSKDELLKGSIEKITDKEETWDIYEAEDVLPDKFQSEENNHEKFQIRIAVPRLKPKSYYKLYSFFATNISLKFPYVIHATFDLDQNRKQLENSKKNEFVTEKLTELMCKMALYKTEGKVDWSAFKMLQYKTENENLKELGFYQKIDGILKNENIIPCVSEKYYSQQEVVYLGDSFANLIQLDNVGNTFSKHAKPVFSGVNFEVFKPRYTAYSNFVQTIDKWSVKIESLEVRAKLIKYLVERNKKYDLSDRFNVFLNEDLKVIDKKNEIFTHITSDFSIPEFCLIEVLNPRLFNLLVDTFYIKEDSKKDRARTLQGIVKSICNVHPFEYIPLSRKIINNTVSFINLKPQEKNKTLREMLISLYKNFNPEINYTSIGILDVPIFDLSGNIKNASDLFFSEGYPLGKICNDIFGKLHNERNQIASTDFLGLESEDIQQVQVYLSWLGVNKYVKYFTKSINSNQDSYVRRVVGYTPTSANVQVLDFEGREVIVDLLSPEQFLVWLFNDTVLLDNLNQEEKKHGEVVKFKYNIQRSKLSKKSYLAGILENSFYNFNNHLMDNTFKSINDIEIDYSNSLFKKHQIKRKDIDSVLRKLGAINDFNELSIERVQAILEKVNTLYKNGRNTSAYYRRAYLHFEENGNHLNKNIELFAKDAEGLKLYHQNEIYFSDKIKLPKKLRSEFPVFNFPKRSGGKKAIDFFGINDLSEIEIELINFNKDDFVTKLIHDYISTLYPFILIHRVNALDNESSKRKDASKLQSLIINVCNVVETKVGDKTFALDDYEFIFLEGSGYYLKLPKSNDLEVIQKHPDFKDTIADILSHLFDVSGHKSDFRALLSTDIDDVKHITKVNFGNDLLDETLAILGFSNPIISFWTTIYRIKGKELSFEEEIHIDFNQINKDLSLSINTHLPDYNSIKNVINIPYLIDLFSELGISISDYNSYSNNTINFFDFHINNLTSFFINKSILFKHSLHFALKSRESFEVYLQRLHDYEFKFEVFLKSISMENRFEFNIENENVFNQFMIKEFSDITLIESKNFIDIDSIYQNNKMLLSEKEFEIIKNSSELKSRIHFEIDMDELKTELSRKTKVELEPETIENNEIENEIFIEKKVKSFETKKWSGYKNRKKLFNPNATSNQTNEQIGKTSEEKVYRHLCTKYSKEFVHYKAKEDEGLHYDIRYSADEGNKFVYVEVKTYSRDTFILSREEFEFGKEKKDLYEIWLVNRDELIIFDKNLEKIDLVVKDFYVAFSELNTVLIN